MAGSVNRLVQLLIGGRETPQRWRTLVAACVVALTLGWCSLWRGPGAFVVVDQGETDRALRGRPWAPPPVRYRVVSDSHNDSVSSFRAEHREVGSFEGLTFRRWDNSDPTRWMGEAIEHPAPAALRCDGQNSAGLPVGRLVHRRSADGRLLQFRCDFGREPDLDRIRLALGADELRVVSLRVDTALLRSLVLPWNAAPVWLDGHVRRAVTMLRTTLALLSLASALLLAAVVSAARARRAVGVAIVLAAAAVGTLWSMGGVVRGAGSASARR